eukprot:3733388-Lingulodinium_polyedra.AAC.1
MLCRPLAATDGDGLPCIAHVWLSGTASVPLKSLTLLALVQVSVPQSELLSADFRGSSPWI